jgi:7 transmembrane sweet-taste receptor of 3 GCPR
VTKGGRIAVGVIAGFFAICSIFLMVFVASHREHNVWNTTPSLFLFSSLIGAVISYVGIVLTSADPSTATCTASLWFYVLGMSLILGNLFAMTFRVWRLSATKSSEGVNNMDILPLSSLVVVLTLVILVAWSAMDAPYGYTSTRGLDDLEYVIICDSPDDGLVFFCVLISLFCILLLACISMTSFNNRPESDLLLLCAYNLTQVLILIVVFVFALDSPDARHMLTVICMLFGVTMTVGLLFIPKVWETVSGKRVPE